MTRGIVLLATLGMTACATLSKDECLTGNWQAIGLGDGAAGQPPNRVSEHAEACARHGVALDVGLWRIGYDQGLVSYCTRPSGFQSGVRGAAYHGVCPGESAAVFLTAYADGRRVYEVREALQSARNDRGRIVYELDEAHEDRDWARNRAREDDVPDDERRELLERVEDLSEKIGRLDVELEEVEHAIRHIEDDVRQVESRMRYAYPEWNGY